MDGLQAGGAQQRLTSRQKKAVADKDSAIKRIEEARKRQEKVSSSVWGRSGFTSSGSHQGISLTLQVLACMKDLSSCSAAFEGVSLGGHTVSLNVMTLCRTRHVAVVVMSMRTTLWHQMRMRRRKRRRATVKKKR
jgi:hypothetical protein